jgi:hypothetical protein
VKFEIAVQALVEAGVDFALIGGWAAILNGSVTTTRDLDICYARSPENLRRLAEALAPYKPRPRDFPSGLPFVWDTVMLGNTTALTLATELGPVDLLAEVAGLGSFDQVKASSKLVDAFGCRVWTLNLKGLIAAKRAAGCPKDLHALPELEGLLEAGED